MDQIKDEGTSDEVWLEDIALKEAAAFSAGFDGEFAVDVTYEDHVRESAAKPDATARALCAMVRRDCGDAAAEILLSGKKEKNVLLCYENGEAKTGRTGVAP